MMFRLTKVIKILLISNVSIFVLTFGLDEFVFQNRTMIETFGLVPAHFVSDFWFWQILTYSFLHGSVMHLALNCLMLAFIGSELNIVWGNRRFLLFYFACVIGAGMCYLLMQLLISGGLYAPMVGASGGIYGLLLAYGIIFSERMLLFMMIFPMKAKHFVWLLAGIEFLSTVFSRGLGGGLSGVAHLGGMATGFAYLYGEAYLRIQQRRRKERPSVRRKGRKKKASQHLKLVISNNDNEFEEDHVPKDPKNWH